MLVDGHGTLVLWMVMGLSFSRYTEARMSKIALKCFVISIRIPLIKITMMDQNEPLFFRHVFQTLLSMVRQGQVVGMARPQPTTQLAETIDAAQIADG